MREGVRDFLVCVSLSNLVLLHAWRDLFDNSSYVAAIQASHYLAVILAGIFLAAAFWCCAWTARRLGGVADWVARWAFLQILVVCITDLSMPVIPVERRPVALMMNFVFPFLLLAIPKIPRWFATLLLVLVPCVAFLLVRSAWEICRAPKSDVVIGSLDRMKEEGPRVLLIVFDEMSEYVAFTERPDQVEMPAFDRLVSEGIVAAAAYPPGRATLLSMPALLTGRPIREVRPVSGEELRVRFLEGGRFESFAESSTVFSDVHALGLGTAMIGWYHPYCWVFGGMDFCAHIKAGMVVPGIYENGGVGTQVLDILSQKIPVVNVTNWARGRHAQASRKTLELEDSFLEATTASALTNFHSGLMVVHLPVPHPPGIKGRGMYFSNLIAADRELATVRGIMERLGTWDNSAVLVTSDHWWRTHQWTSWNSLLWTESERAYADADEDPRVPFIAKLPGQHPSMKYTQKFNVLLTRKLVSELLAGKITKPEELKTWLDLHRNDVPVFAYSYNLSTQ